MSFIQNSIKAYLDVVEAQQNKNNEQKKQSVEALEKEIEKLKAELAKAKADADLQVQPNADTGEIPLRVGVAQALLDKGKKKNG